MDRPITTGAGDGSAVAKASDGENENGICQYLTWDSTFFGRRIANVTVNRLTGQTMQQIQSWCDVQRIDCLYFLADSSDSETVTLAEDAGFRFVDIRVTLERKIEQLPSSGDTRGSIRPYRADDLSTLRNIARVSHHDSRFYHDKKFPESLCDALYETWIEKSAHGYADIVWVATLQDEPLGYISCHWAPSGNPRIGLFAVAKQAQGLGLGKHLLLEGLRWFAQKGVPTVSVVTQGRNIRGQRLYQGCGFVTRSMQLWYHYWPSSKTPGAT